MDGDGAQEGEEHYGEGEEDEGGSNAGSLESDKGKQRQAKADANSFIRDANATSFSKGAANCWIRLRWTVSRGEEPAKDSCTETAGPYEDGELSTAISAAISNIEKSGEQSGQGEDVERGEAKEDEEYDRHDVSLISCASGLHPQAWGFHC